MKIKVKDVRPIIIRDTKTKEEICRSCAINLAQEIVKHFEQEDMMNRCYVENSYEIYNTRTNEII